MIIRKAQGVDFFQLYELGKNTPELRVSATEEFMDPDEFVSAMGNRSGVFLLAEENSSGEDSETIGFIYANTLDAERTLVKKWACLVYIVVKESHRGKGIAQQLYDACVSELKRFGVTHLYGWARVEGNGAILEFMKIQNFSEGRKYVWMDKKI